MEIRANTQGRNDSGTTEKCHILACSLSFAQLAFWYSPGPQAQAMMLPTEAGLCHINHLLGQSLTVMAMVIWWRQLFHWGSLFLDTVGSTKLKVKTNTQGIIHNIRLDKVSLHLIFFKSFMMYLMSEFIFKTKQYCTVCKYNVVFIEMLALTNSPPPHKSMTPFILQKQSKCDIFHPTRPLAFSLLKGSGADFEPLAS